MNMQEAMEARQVLIDCVADLLGVANDDWIHEHDYLGAEIDRRVFFEFKDANPGQVEVTKFAKQFSEMLVDRIIRDDRIDLVVIPEPEPATF